MSGSPLWSTITPFVAALVVGLELLLIGLRGRRVGQTPYCGRCGYDLTGLTGQRCPECGRAVTTKAVVRGERRRRLLPLVLGLLLSVLSASSVGVLIYGRVKQVDWYRYYPAALLSQQAHRDDGKAIAEFIRRLRAGALKPEELPALIEAALIRHAAAPVVIARNWADLLALIDNSNGLTAEQRERFYSQVAPLHVELDEQVEQGRSLVIRYSYEDRVSRLLRRVFSLRVRGLRIDGWYTPEPYVDPRLSLPLGLFGPSGNRNEAGLISMRRELAVGLHRAELFVDLVAFDVWTSPAMQAQWMKEHRFQSDLRVVPGRPRMTFELSPIPLCTDEAVACSARDAIRVNHVFTAVSGASAQPALHAELDLEEPVELCLAFLVSADCDGREFEIGTLTWPAGTSGLRTSLPIDNPIRGGDALPDDLTQVSLILRSSEIAARRDQDCPEAWEGELVFGPLPVIEQRPPASAAGPAAKAEPVSDDQRMKFMPADLIGP